MCYLQVIDLGYASGVRIFRTSCFGNQAHDWQLLLPSEVSDLGSRLLLEILEQFGLHSNEYHHRVNSNRAVTLLLELIP